MPNNVEQLRSIQTFKQLIPYLEQELDWPFPEGRESYEFEDLTFEYSAEELGLEDEYAAKIKKIHQLRPFVTGQPWGIFFVEFDNKKLPIVVLRRILSHLVLKKRKSANPADKARWNAGDLLFISAFAEEGTSKREIAFAHFHQEQDDQPTLRVLGWDGGDTPLKLESVASLLKHRLCWPSNPADHATWRKQWGSAFRYTIGQQVRTADMLAKELARVARKIHDAVLALMKVESSRGPLKRMHEAFKTALIQDLTKEGFADTYAQTITYGLLTAAISRTDRSAGAEGTFVLAEDIHNMVPITNPFLKEMLESFLKVGGRNTARHPGLDFDELGVQDVVQLLRSSDIDLPAVLEDFGNRNPGEDPVIRFYEDFLSAYNKKLKVQRGVFYTPLPVVSYIVRSVHELLQTEFGLEDGLASTITWAEMAAKTPGLKIPEGTKSSDPFVVILDPATGTATFLVEAIDVIHRAMEKRWKREGHMALEFERLWNEYVPKHLLPRIFGYELMMAPYAIAHMKIGLKLFETGYRFESEERVRVYLTNALEPATDFKKQREFENWVPALAHEAQAVSAVKRDQRFTVVVGNPPYSRVSQNQGGFIQQLLRHYKEPVSGEANQQPLDDDYIKFLRLAHYLQSAATCGIIGFITNHTVISGILFRGVRQRLLEDQTFLGILDLHGNSNIKEKCPDGSKDENVFDIQAGVAVTIGAKVPWKATRQLIFQELWGLRSTKYVALQRLSVAVGQKLAPSPPYFFFKPIDLSAGDELVGAFSLPEIFPSYSSGLMTVRDNLAIAFNRKELHARFEMFRTPSVSDSQFQTICPVKDYRRWSLSGARKKVRADKDWSKRLEVVNYRPFDKRWIFYSSDIITYPNFRVMDQFRRKNLGLISSRIHKGEAHAHEFATREMVEIIFISSKSSNNAFLFPLYTFDADGRLALGEGASPNISRAFLKRLASNFNLQQDLSLGLPQGLTPEDIFHYAYAVLHSPSYRNRYAELLKFEFPRLPLTGSLELFRALARLGGGLVGLHLLESPKLDKAITEYLGDRAPEVEKISWSKNTVWIDKAQAIGFKGVREEVWNFHIGGYQVCEKWLKDRKGRKLLKDDIVHYQKIVVALSETIRLMKEIDEVIEKHGGWPGAFATTEGHTVTS